MKKFTKYPSNYIKSSTGTYREWRISPISIKGEPMYEAYSDRSHSNGLLHFTNEISVKFRVIGDDIQFVCADVIGPGGWSDYAYESDFSMQYPNAMEEIKEQFFNSNFIR